MIPEYDIENDEAGIDRRGFLGSAVVTSALVAGAGVSQSARAFYAAPMDLPVHAVVVDRRHPAAAQFGRVASAAGHSIEMVDDDVVPLWHERLMSRARQRPGLIVGLTSAPATFCMEMLASNLWMRMRFSGQHLTTPDGGIEHVLRGPTAMLDRARTLEEGNWGTAASQLLLAETSSGVDRGGRTVRSQLRSTAAAWREPLFSWVLAPKTQA